MIICKDIVVKYDKFTAINKLSLSLDRNVSCAIIGKSGCGKTTLLYALAGLLELESGQIEIDRQGIKCIRKKIGLVLQSHGLFPWKTVRDNVSLGLKVRKVDSKIIKEEVSMLLKELNIYDHKDKYINELSGGQRQRVAIARSLAIKPELLLMDEPTSSLDAITKEDFQKLVLRLYKNHDLTMVFVTHDIEEAVFLGQKIIVMEDGEIKRELDNPLFGNERIRNELDFYKMCLKVRETLGEA
ncbi:ABC transporter ATP-binding protein [Wukongibacter baidiensis]|uniref:ABC transporter ATP-binding protein n=1 Tax=Wukongibacter baidiensis TaxID=1723361 RepID=UPI003D7F5C5D